MVICISEELVLLLPKFFLPLIPALYHSILHLHSNLFLLLIIFRKLWLKQLQFSIGILIYILLILFFCFFIIVNQRTLQGLAPQLIIHDNGEQGQKEVVGLGVKHLFYPTHYEEFVELERGYPFQDEVELVAEMGEEGGPEGGRGLLPLRVKT